MVAEIPVQSCPVRAKAALFLARKGDLDEQWGDGIASDDGGIPEGPRLLEVTVGPGGDPEEVQGIGVVRSVTEGVERFGAVG